MYLVAGIALWWPVVHGRTRPGVKAAYLFAAFVLASPIGLMLALVPRPVYSFYEHARRTWGPGPLGDQQIAGVTMAVEQAVVFFAVFTMYLFRFLREEERDPRPADFARRSVTRQRPERRDQRAVRRAGRRLRGEIPDRAGPPGEVRDELHAAMLPHPLRHVAHVLRVVEAPEAPFRERERLRRVRLVQLLRRRPRRTVAADVVQVVADHVDVRVARVVRLRRVAGDVRRAEALRVPDHAQLRRRHRQVGADPRSPSCASFAFIASRVPPRKITAMRASAFRFQRVECAASRRVPFCVVRGACDPVARSSRETGARRSGRRATPTIVALSWKRNVSVCPCAIAARRIGRGCSRRAAAPGPSSRRSCGASRRSRTS